MIKPIQNSISGLQQSAARFNRAADVIVQAPTNRETSAETTAIIAVTVEKQTSRSLVSLLKTTDEMLGAVLDIKA